MKHFKTGRLAPVHTARTFRCGIALSHALQDLGPAPAVSSDYVSAVDKVTGGNWGMMGNDQWGDCTIADGAHQVMLHTANAGTIIIPTTDECKQVYFGLTGGQDTGLDESAVCQFMMTTGIAGQKSAGTGMLDPTYIEHIKWSIQLFGACRFGIVVDERMEEQFNSRQPWNQAADPRDPNAGGHDVPAVKYDANYIWVVTWAGLQPVEWHLVQDQNFLSEAHGEVYPDWMRAGGTAPNGFDLGTLLGKLQQIEYQSARAVWSISAGVSQPIAGGAPVISAGVTVSL